MNVPNSDLLLERIPPSSRTMILASFATDLAQGNTVKGKPVRSTTIEGYLRHVATLLTQFYDRDPRYDRVGDQKMSPSIHAVLAEVKRFEKMPDRRDPYTLDMHDTFRQMNDENNAPFLGLHRALEDWFLLGLYLGPRLQEWAQEEQHKELSNPAIADNGTLRAFTLLDILLFDEKGRPVSIETWLNDPTAVAYAIIVFSWQKNGEHGEKRRLDKNIFSPARCGLTALRNILIRYNRLVGISDHKTPLAVFRGSHKTLFVHSTVISKTLCTIAKRTYSLTTAELNKHYRYTSHSLRVGACVLLHSAGVNAVRIKFLLRWKSDSFMLYLRNVAQLSNVQNQAISMVANGSAIPIVF